MILGIDPGPIESAYCGWDGKHIQCGQIVLNSDLTLILNTLDRNVIVACEHLQCFGMAVGASVFETAYSIGDFRATCRSQRILFLPVYRSEVKMYFCGHMRAKDSNIRQALIDCLGAPGTKKNKGATYGVKGDMWSALAIAVMVWDQKPKYERNRNGRIL